MAIYFSSVVGTLDRGSKCLEDDVVVRTNPLLLYSQLVVVFVAAAAVVVGLT